MTVVIVVCLVCYFVVVAGAQEDGNQTVSTLAGNLTTSEPLLLLDICDEATSFRCANDTDVIKCISKQVYCDGVYDCLDGSDEETCFFDTCPQRSHVTCSDKSACVAPLKICDGKIDCRDNSDEFGCCE